MSDRIVLALESTDPSKGVSMNQSEQQASRAFDRVHVLGAGAWGTTLAVMMCESGRSVTLVAHRASAARVMQTERRHPVSLPGLVLPDRLTIEHNGAHSLEQADALVLVVPVQSLRAAVAPLASTLMQLPVLCAAKGLEVDTRLRSSEVVASVLGTDANIAVLSGPNLSAEIAAGKPASAVIASTQADLGGRFAATVRSRRFRTYVHDDVIGVELGGALKNIVAIGAGIADGLDAGDNAKAAFMSRGIAEIARLGVACGARPLTFAGLSGIGDLIATCASRLSRNHQVGFALANGRPIEEIVAGMSETAEGVATTKAAWQMGRELEVDLPIVNQMYRILFEGASPIDAVARLLEREPGSELAGWQP